MNHDGTIRWALPLAPGAAAHRGWWKGGRETVAPERSRSRSRDTRVDDGEEVWRTRVQLSAAPLTNKEITMNEL